MFCSGTQWQAQNVSILHLEQLLVKIHYKDGATIFGAVTKRCFCHNSAPTIGVGTSGEYGHTSVDDSIR